MGLELRNGRVYYYRKRRAGGKVVNEYGGKGSLARVAFLQDGAAQEESKMRRKELAELEREQRQIDQALEGYADQVRQVVATLLQRLGYHRHRRQWRLRRGREDSKLADEVVAQASRNIFAEYNEILAAATVAKPKPADLERLRQYGLDNPGIFEGFSMMAKNTTDQLLDLSGVTEATKIHIKGEIRSLERGLGYKTASEMERLLIKSISMCWLRLWFFEQHYTACHHTGDGVTFAKADYLEKRLSATQRRYLRAIESLARVRGLLVRAGVQINVAGQQVVVNN